ncbi:MAG: nucleoside-diphosphate sugar epimerase [Acidimicrobiaceae bacterium]|nr:nucleoside-diphosphate sugar epimerase [Acidimicrobiaceae bacterium]|tara:strand:+ start:32 stop:991 length:960 start_codon:yes stop_codon:yes gene_type:complete
MRALITGGAGFIGSHLADRLLDRGDQVVLLDDLSTGRLANIEHLTGNPDAEFVLGSILNPDLVDHVVSRCDVVYHLAAAVGVNLIVEKPLESLMTNIRGTEVVVEKAHKYGRRTLVASTSEIYGKNVSDRLSEDDDRILGSPLKSRWSYSEAKAIDEILAYTYWREKGLETVIVRLFNTVGPRQTGSYGMVIPRFVTQALRGEPLTVFGDGSQTRCFCSVHDVVGGILVLSEEPEAFGRVFNLGGSEEISMSDLAERVIRLAGSSSSVEFIPYDVAYEEGFEDMQRRVPDTTRARELVGFHPSEDLNGIIKAVIAHQQR